MDKTILVAVSIIVFFAGFGVGSVVFYNQPNMPILGHGMTGPMYSPQVMNQMMDDPQLRQQMIDTMMENPQFMNNLMQNQDFMQRINP
ncbi:MAG TPA: hypothetical protein VMW74_01160 [Nitrosopumilaceae archaeon]|nr:hypothetical protein [Nitrosopumilaceae archaeon]